MVKRFELSDGMLLGYAPIDDEHRALVESLNALAALPADCDQDRIAATLDAFIDAFESHCRLETERFREFGFPKTESHQQHHDDLIARLRELRDQGGNPDELSSEALWILLEEAIREDLQAKSFLQHNGIAD